MDWTTLVRQYLALHDPALLEQAIAAAHNSRHSERSEESVAALLSAFQQRDFATVDRLAESLHTSLQSAGRMEDALTVALLHADLRARLVEFYNQFPFEQQMQALQIGLEACDEAILIATLLGDLPCVATYNIFKGTGSYYARDLEAARAAYEEGLEIRRRLAQSQPQVYLPDVAMTLNNLGTVLRDLREMEAARAAYKEAIDLREQCSLWLDSAETHYNWGLLEEGEGDAAGALELFEACVERCERGLSQLTEREHRDLFKGKIEFAYEWLIGHYARLAESDGRATRERLVGLMESLRRVETLAGLGEGASDQSVTEWQEAFRDLMEGKGALSDLFREQRCAFLWVHATRSEVVFVSLTPGKCEVQRAERGLMEKFWELFEEAERGMKMPRPNVPRISDWAAFEEGLGKVVSGLLDAHQRWLSDIQSAGEAVFNLLPDEVKSLLAGDEYETVFLAPCGLTMNLPFEMIRVTDGWEGKAPAAPVSAGSAGASPSHWSYVGLRKVMARVHGLAELARVVKRQPDLSGARTALVVGNPPHGDAPSLEHAETRAIALAGELKARGYRLVGGAGRAGRDAPPLLGHAATEEAVLNGLAQKPILWVHNGHGGLLSLLLAGSDELTSQTVARQRWGHHPIIHNDCCRSGATLRQGGGRFDGHPTAALIAGASCVLSSVHALWDDSAKEFSERLYGKALDNANPLPLGGALLQTRQEMAQEHHDNPLVWATTVLWGNPWARLA